MSHLFATDGSNTYIYAVDIAAKSVAYVDIVATDAVPSGFGDAAIVWTDPATLQVLPKGSGHAFMVYSGSIIYYDLQRGEQNLPFPIPEPWFTSLAVVATLSLCLLIYIRKYARPNASHDLFDAA